MDKIKEAPSVTTRLAATANLMIDSFDRNADVYPTPWAFIIQKKSSILNGFFNRIGTTEVVLEWAIANIGAAFDNTDFTVTWDDGATTTTETITVAGNFTVEELLDTIAIELNSAFATPNLFSVAAQPGGGASLNILAGNTFEITATTLSSQLGITSTTAFVSGVSFTPNDVDLRPYRYLDFTSSQLTYNQELKDATTQENDKNVLCRWYFAYDNPLPVDAYGFPVLMGYIPFQLRRLFNPAKQIRWDSAQPIGQLGFEVFGQRELGGYEALAVALAGVNQQNNDFLMTLQVSEN